MIEETAVIARVEGDIALVQPERAGGCGGCASKSTCGAGALAQAFGGGGGPTLVRARNPIGARPGQRVVIGITETALNKAAILSYLLPILGLIAGALLGEYLTSRLLTADGEPGAILGGLSGLVAVFIWLRAYSGRNADELSLQPVILRFASHAEPIEFRPRAQSHS